MAVKRVGLGTKRRRRTEVGGSAMPGLAERPLPRCWALWPAVSMLGGLVGGLVCAPELAAQSGRPPVVATAPASAPIAAPAAPVVARGDSVTIRLVDADLRAAVQALGSYVDRPVLFGAGAGIPNAGRVTLETPQPVPRGDVVRLLRGLVESQGLEFVLDSTAGLYRVAAKEPQRVTPPPVSRPGMSGGAGSGSQQAPELFVIRLRHARATELVATINALFGIASAVGELGGPGTGPTLGQSLNQQTLPPQQPAPPVQAAPTSPGLTPLAGETVPGAAGRVAQLSGRAIIVPDANSNALLIRGPRSDFELIQAAVQVLDVRPLQALVEIVIAEIRRDRSFNFGVEWGTPERQVPGLDGVTASATQKGIGLGDVVLRVMRDGPGIDFDATLRASAARGDARILSRPVVIASNGEVAEILVGSQRPFVQVQRSLPTDTPTRDQVVQYKDVGTRLSVRPTMSADGYVSLAITQEVNSATAETQFDAPVISTRTLQTTLVVRDSQTVVLGGLSDRLQESGQGGVPVLSRIPLVGGLFGRATRQASDTEFFIFVRPRIIRTDEEADAVTRPLEQRARGAHR